MERLIFVDSNIWCYYFDRSARSMTPYREAGTGPRKWSGHKYCSGDGGCSLSHQKLGSEGKRKMDVFLSYPMEIIDFDQYLARKSVEYLAKYSQTGIGGRDATILASMEELGTRKLMTHDRAFKRLDFIEVVDPVS